MPHAKNVKPFLTLEIVPNVLRNFQPNDFETLYVVYDACDSLFVKVCVVSSVPNA